MASRDIANMHLFLDLKKRFPHLPDDLLRRHVSMFSEDQEKCLRLLRGESQNHPPFSDFRLPEGARRNDGIQGTTRSMPLDAAPLLSVKRESHSAPVIQSSQEQPFADIYHRQHSVSSQNTLHQGQTIFSTTKEHRVGLPEPKINSRPQPPGRHTVRLSITPSFPFQQQQSVGTSPQRHTTSVDFQLQPPWSSSGQRPFVISTIPANVPSPDRSSGSHVQISVGSRGQSTFTALRFSSHPEGESSQTQNSYWCLSPGASPKLGSRNSGALYHPAQPSPSYILAVQNEQIARLDLIVSELEREKSLCSQLRAEITELENRVARNNNVTRNSFSNAQKLKEVREENKQLRTECNCLYIETDMYGSEEIPPCDTEDFYSQIFTGPNGAIIPVTEDPAKRPMKSRSEEDEDEEQSRWVCKKCTFANHPALVKCEMCEVPKDIEEDYRRSYHTFPPSRGLPPRPNSQRPGSVQISITHSPKNLKLHLARKGAR